MFRLGFTYFTFVLVTLVYAPFGILAWPFRRDGEVSFFITRLWARAILAAAGARTVVELQAPLPEGPVVFVSNHVSSLDIPVLFATLPRSFRIVYKSSLLYVPLLGQFLAAARHIAIDRSKAMSARRSLEAAARRIHNGVSVALFPEGTRSFEAGMAPFKRGSFKLAVDAEVPVVPVSLIGLERMVGKRSLKPGTVRVKIHEALAHEGGPEAVENLAARAEAMIRKDLEEE